ncbi:hypothetical protein LTR35_018291, partial [Friedmanniomyces endolithicus]
MASVATPEPHALVMTSSLSYLLPEAPLPTDQTSYPTASARSGKKERMQAYIPEVHESDHWMAIRIDWTERLIQHYDPLHQSATARSRLTLQ